MTSTSAILLPFLSALSTPCFQAREFRLTPSLIIVNISLTSNRPRALFLPHQPLRYFAPGVTEFSSSRRGLLPKFQVHLDSAEKMAPDGTN
ncbi:hypothetical protein RRG08_021408 [Elysia crispata]|uniref:Secreted protein n=1 Tax=Elysia crispata TaxID=231223 RepID=A0AAE1A6A5_9GAST|nr:hypothetical protein RRG08_021408 [Elysia crispata]